MSKLISSLSNDLLLIDKDLVNSQEKQNNLKTFLNEESYETLLTQVKKIPFASYQAWIPNNGGFLSWTRIGVEYEVKKRYSFKANIFTKDKEVIPPIEVIDTDVDINDRVISLFAKDKSLKPIFVTTVKFQEKNSISEVCEDIISGKGHLVENGIYKGESILAFFSKKEYKKLLNKKIDEELKQIYSSLSYNDYNRCYEELVSFFDKNKPCHAFKVSYEVEPKGKINIQSISILNNPDTDFTIESICSIEGYKQLVQLLYGQIKKVFHGDNHHNHKDDVILKVYESEAKDLTLPLKQMVEHMKGLEKIEKNRHKMMCKEFIPSYVHEADGIVAYAEMYQENYITKDDYKKQGERFIKAAKAIHKSLKSIVDRNNDSYDLTVNNKKKSRNIATETATYILLFAFFAFILKGNTTIHPERNDVFAFLIFLIGCMVEINFLLAFFFVFIMLLIFKNKFHFCLCKWFYLHKDLRPKDKYYARYLNKSSFYKYYQTLKFGLITLILISLLFILSGVAN